MVCLLGPLLLATVMFKPDGGPAAGDPLASSILAAAGPAGPAGPSGPPQMPVDPNSEGFSTASSPFNGGPGGGGPADPPVPQGDPVAPSDGGVPGPEVAPPPSPTPTPDPTIVNGTNLTRNVGFVADWDQACSAGREVLLRMRNIHGHKNRATAACAARKVLQSMENTAKAHTSGELVRQAVETYLDLLQSGDEAALAEENERFWRAHEKVALLAADAELQPPNDEGGGLQVCITVH